MTQYVCSSCNYKFSSFREPKKCPYCSRAGTVKQEATAADILKDVDNMLEDGRAF